MKPLKTLVPAGESAFADYVAKTNLTAILFALFDEYAEIPLPEMGLPPDWRNHPLWKV